jgi:hypothetical protein
MNKFLIVSIFFFSQFLNAQNYPLGFVKNFEAVFIKEKLATQFVLSGNTSSLLKNGIWYTEVKKDSLEQFMPSAVILIDNYVFGDFIADINFQFKSINNDSLSGLYIIAGLRDSSNYYFIQLSNKGASFYKMYKGEVSLIKNDSLFVISENNWQNMRITRDIITRTVQIDIKNQSLEFADPNLVMGYLGLGIQGSKLAMKKFVVWSPASISKSATIFR